MRYAAGSPARAVPSPPPLHAPDVPRAHAAGGKSPPHHDAASASPAPTGQCTKRCAGHGEHESAPPQSPGDHARQTADPNRTTPGPVGHGPHPERKSRCRALGSQRGSDRPRGKTPHRRRRTAPAAGTGSGRDAPTQPHAERASGLPSPPPANDPGYGTRAQAPGS